MRAESCACATTRRLPYSATACDLGCSIIKAREDRMSSSLRRPFTWTRPRKWRTSGKKRGAAMRHPYDRGHVPIPHPKWRFLLMAGLQDARRRQLWTLISATQKSALYKLLALKKPLYYLTNALGHARLSLHNLLSQSLPAFSVSNLL